jgi:hypothetical protein
MKNSAPPGSGGCATGVDKATYVAPPQRPGAPSRVLCRRGSCQLFCRCGRAPRGLAAAQPGCLWSGDAGAVGDPGRVRASHRCHVHMSYRTSPLQAPWSPSAAHPMRRMAADRRRQPCLITPVFLAQAQRRLGWRSWSTDRSGPLSDAAPAVPR